MFFDHVLEPRVDVRPPPIVVSRLGTAYAHPQCDFGNPYHSISDEIRREKLSWAMLPA